MLHYKVKMQNDTVSSTLISLMDAACRTVSLKQVIAAVRAVLLCTAVKAAAEVLAWTFTGSRKVIFAQGCAAALLLESVPYIMI